MSLIIISVGIFLYKPNTANADETNDLAFVIEFADLADMVDEFNDMHNAASDALLNFIESIENKDSFKGQKKFEGPLRDAGFVYLQIADQAAEVFVADPRNSDMIETIENAASASSDIYARFAKCARTGKRKFCMRVFNDVGGIATFAQANEVTIRVAEEASVVIADFETKYGSFQAARTAIESGDSGVLSDKTDTPVMLDIENTLSRLGYDPGPVDGSFDDQTQNALSELIANAEGVYPMDDPDGLLEALNYLVQDAQEFPEDRDWGNLPELNRKLADATDYLGGFSDKGFPNWVSRQPPELDMHLQVYGIELAFLKLKEQATTKKPTVDRKQVLATLRQPVAGVHKCDRLAADPFDPKAQAEGITIRNIDSDRAIAACQAARNTAASEARFAFQLARAFMSADQAEKARPIFTALAAHGHAPSIAHLGYLDYLAMDGAENMTAARKYLTIAADSSDLALNILVDMLRNGDGGDTAPVEAARWLKIGIIRSRNKGMTQILADMYKTGEGVDQAPDLAENLLAYSNMQLANTPARAARAQGHTDSKYTTPTPTVFVPSTVIAPDTAPALVYAGLPATGQHWLSISAPEMAGKDYYYFEMLDLGQTDGVINGPALPVGTYQARLFLNWPEGEYQIIDVAPIEVMASFEMTLRRRQIVIELDKFLTNTDTPELHSLLETARNGDADAVRHLAKALIVQATRYAMVSAELAEIDPLAAAINLMRYAVELMPEDSDIIRSAGMLYLMLPDAAGLHYDAESLLGYAVELDADDRMARWLWIEALVKLTRYESAAQQLTAMWPPLKNEERLIGLVSDIYLGMARPEQGLEMLETEMPENLLDATTLAQATLNFEIGNKTMALTLVQALVNSPNPYYAMIGENMTPKPLSTTPSAPLKLPE